MYFPQTITPTTLKASAFQKDSYFELLPPTENTKHLKVLYVGLTPSAWTKYCSQRVFLIRALLLRLDAGCQINGHQQKQAYMTVNDMKYAVFFRQLATRRG